MRRTRLGGTTVILVATALASMAGMVVTEAHGAMGPLSVTPERGCDPP